MTSLDILFTQKTDILWTLLQGLLEEYWVQVLDHARKDLVNSKKESGRRGLNL